MKHLLLSFAFCSLLSSCTQEDLIVEKSLPTKITRLRIATADLFNPHP